MSYSKILWEDRALSLSLITDNMRYALDECLYSYPKNLSQDPLPWNQCSTPCSPISSALETHLDSPNSSSTFDFCQSGVFLNQVQNCASCYRIIPDQLYLSNCTIKFFDLTSTYLIVDSPQHPRIRMSKSTIAYSPISHQTLPRLHRKFSIKLLDDRRQRQPLQQPLTSSNSSDSNRCSGLSLPHFLLRPRRPFRPPPTASKTTTTWHPLSQRHLPLQ